MGGPAAIHKGCKGVKCDGPAKFIDVPRARSQLGSALVAHQPSFVALPVALFDGMTLVDRLLALGEG